MRDLFKLSFKQLMLSNVFLGSRKENFYAFMRPFILGYRTSFCILNLFYTYIQFKLLINILINILFYRKKILIIKEEDLFNFKVNFWDRKSVFFYDKKWIGGSLTNYRIVSRHPKFAELSQSFPRLRGLRFLPSFLFLFNTDVSEYALFEGYILGILTSAIASSDCFYYESINYPIVGSVDSYESMYLYMHILKDCVGYAFGREFVSVLCYNATKYSKFIKRLVWRALRKAIKRKKRKIKAEERKRKRDLKIRALKQKILMVRILWQRVKIRALLLIVKVLKAVKILKNVKDLRLVLQKKRLLKFKLLRLRELIKKCKLFFKKGYIPKNYRSLKRTFSNRLFRFNTLKSKRLTWALRVGRFKFSYEVKELHIYRLVRRMKRLRRFRRRIMYLKLESWKQPKVLEYFKSLRLIDRIRKNKKIRKRDKKWIMTHVW